MRESQNYPGDYTLCVRSVGGMERAWGRGGEGPELPGRLHPVCQVCMWDEESMGKRREGGGGGEEAQELVGACPSLTHI